MATPSAPPLQRSALGDRWAEVVAAMNGAGSIAALVRELAMQSQLQAIDALSTGECWRLVVDRDALRAQALVDKLQAAVREVTSLRQLQLDVQAGVVSDSPARRDAEAAAAQQQAAQQAFLADPLVQSVQHHFATARVLSGTIKPN